MKTMKKYISLALALCLAFSLSVTASEGGLCERKPAGIEEYKETIKRTL